MSGRGDGHRWADAPRGVRVTFAVLVAIFAYGAAVHLTQLHLGGLDPYPAMPSWLAAYFGSLALLDPAAALLLALRRRAGLALGAVVLTTDALANAYANYVVDRTGGVTPGRMGQAVIAALALGLLLAAPRIAPWLNGGRDRAGRFSGR
ncbi:hypothetical protein GCM10020358_16640 [Amorphoplanes nipponensis]|uniref:Uncharacterized protein n=1 Tax=Actinoplanes nipponensis TaxID=135950 RepID=A0A919MSV4_9ACTN|nr:hypothetical protein [Actinoplanes nipponensis]GIE52968.1 hypothetical protein Ani05nite_65020 [Actinoplanes nipponensis]